MIPLTPKMARLGNNDEGRDHNDVDTNTPTSTNTENVVHELNTSANTREEMSSNTGIQQTQDRRMSQHVAHVRSLCQSFRTSMLSEIDTFEKNCVDTIMRFLDGEREKRENVEDIHGHGHRRQHAPERQELHSRTLSLPPLPVLADAIPKQKLSGGHGCLLTTEKDNVALVVHNPLPSSLAVDRNGDTECTQRRSLKRVRFEGLPDNLESEAPDIRVHGPVIKTPNPSSSLPQTPPQNGLTASSVGDQNTTPILGSYNGSRQTPISVVVRPPGRGRGRGMRRTRLTRATTVEDLNKIVSSDRSLTPSSNTSGGNSISIVDGPSLPASAPVALKRSKREMTAASSSASAKAKGKKIVTRKRAVLKENAVVQNSLENVNASVHETENETNRVADNGEGAKGQETSAATDGNGITEDDSQQSRSPTPKVHRSLRSTRSSKGQGPKQTGQ